jgi:hypothetical protein
MSADSIGRRRHKLRQERVNVLTDPGQIDWLGRELYV